MRLLTKCFLMIFELSARFLVRVWADVFGSSRKCPLKSFSANAEYSSKLAKKWNLFGLAKREDNIQLNELSKGSSSPSQRNPGEPCVGAFWMLAFFSELKAPTFLSQPEVVSASMLLFSCGRARPDSFSESFRFVLGMDIDPFI